MNIYVELTKKFNENKLRVILSSGQAVVLHKLAVMSKDGDWIVKEENSVTEYILKTLAEYGAHYRFGAPFDVKWLSGGWSSHFEFNKDNFRVRTDFISRPPRISDTMLNKLWDDQKDKNLPFVDINTLAEIKKTNREKDYVVIGELARLMQETRDQLLYSRSANDLIEISKKHPDVVSKLMDQRPVLKKISEGREKLEKELDAERRDLMHRNEKRLQAYMDASEKWLEIWPDIQKEIAGCNLLEQHKIIIDRAKNVLPTHLKG